MMGKYFLECKKSQFYIMVAVVIVLVIGSLVVLQTKMEEEGKTRIYDLSEELNIETGYVYDHGVYNKKDTNELLTNWTETYSNAVNAGEAEENETWAMVFGDEDNLTAVYYSSEDSGIISIGGSDVEVKHDELNTESFKSENGKFSINFKDFEEEIELNKGQNFYSIIRSGGNVARGGQGEDEDVGPPEDVPDSGDDDDVGSPNDSGPDNNHNN